MSTPYTTLKIAVVAPIPSASVNTAAAVKAGWRNKRRTVRRSSDAIERRFVLIAALLDRSQLDAARNAVDGAVLDLDRDGAHHRRARFRAHAGELDLHACL